MAIGIGWYSVVALLLLAGNRFWGVPLLIVDDASQLESLVSDPM